MRKPKPVIQLIITSLIVAAAVIASVVLYMRLSTNPWTRDARVSAEIIMIAPRVTGTVVAVRVVDNQLVKKGDVLFEIDPGDFELGVASGRVQLDQARQNVSALAAAVVASEANAKEAEIGITAAATQIDAAKAQIAAAEGKVSAAKAGLKSAEASIEKSRAGLDQSIRDRDRAQRLAKDGSGSVATAESKAAGAEGAKATLDGSRASLLSAEASMDQAAAALTEASAGLATAEAGRDQATAGLASARAALAQARADLGVPGEQNVQVRAAKVSLDQAHLDLARTQVLAPTDGYVINLNVDVGDYAAAGTPMLAFVDQSSFHVQGFFKETDLGAIAIGDPAVITLMGYRDQPLDGVVESIGWAINPPDIATTEGTSGLVPQVQPSFDWIRLAQRVPVRIKLGKVPDGIQLVSGTTASVAIRPEK